MQKNKKILDDFVVALQNYGLNKSGGSIPNYFTVKSTDSLF